MACNALCHPLTRHRIAHCALRHPPLPLLPHPLPPPPTPCPLLHACRYYSEMNSRLPLFDDQDLADTISAFSALNALLKQDFLDDFLASVHQKLAGFEPRPLANVLFALGRMHAQVDVAPEWLEDVAKVGGQACVALRCAGAGPAGGWLPQVQLQLRCVLHTASKMQPVQCSQCSAAGAVQCSQCSQCSAVQPVHTC
jgi:hypothetical protein